MKLEIVTPQEKIYSQTVEQVVLPTEEGEVGVLPGHIPLLTKLAPGQLVAVQEGKRDELAVDKGFAQVSEDHISILTEAAIDIEDIDLEEVQAAKERAKSALEEAKKEELDPAEIEALEAQARFAIAQELAKGKRKGV